MDQTNKGYPNQNETDDGTLLAVDLDYIVSSITPAFLLASCCLGGAETVGCSENIPGGRIQRRKTIPIHTYD